MKIFALITVLVAVAQAAPSADVDVSKLVPLDVFMPEIEGAPKPVAPRITNGLTATRGQFPHQAALYLDGSSFCGGSLISNTWILTAAHCAQNIRTFTIHLGAQALSASESGRVTVTSTVKIVHSGYNSNLNNDIALVRLPSAVSLSSFIQLVRLPSRSQVGNSFAGQAVTVSGWGRTSDSSSSISQTLQYVALSVITNAVCQQTYGSSVIISSTICASGTNGRSTCNGDSGGPLVISNNGYTQIGVVSFVSSRGCASGAPSGYVRTTSFLDWISANTGISIS